MLELEVKAALPDDALERLRHLELYPVDQQVHVDMYYRHPCTDFVATDEALRIRRSGDTTVVTYKGPRLGRGAKIREEHEVVASDFNAARMIFESLGFVQVFTIEKTRQRFKRNGMCVAVDDVKGLGRFVEVEMLVDEPTESAEEAIFTFLEAIGISRTSTTRESYLELLNKT